MPTRLTMPGFLRARLRAGPAGSLPFAASLDRYSISVCHEKRIVWFRVAKVGTRTIYDVFKKAGMELKDEQLRFYSSPVRRYPDYFRFAFVRNPWDRLVSCWKDKVVSYNYFRFSDEERSRMKQFSNFVAYLETVDIDHADLHLRSQSKLIDIASLDFTGRFENFSSDLQAVMKGFGSDEVKIRKLNASDNRKNYRKYYDEPLKRRVAGIYHRDIEVFSYDF